MKINAILRLLYVCVLTLFVLTAGLAQAPKKVFSVAYFHKLKPGHTLVEARVIENEWKKIHQAQANDGFIRGWYLLGLDMSTNPNKEYSYITISNFTDPGYMDNSTPEKHLIEVMGSDYRPKLTDLLKRTNEVKEVAKVEIWEHIDGTLADPKSSPAKAPVWLVSNIKVKNGQYLEYMDRVKIASPFNRERVVSGGAAGWSFVGLLLPWGTEKAYDFTSVYQFPSMKALLESDETKQEAAFKKTMPGVDSKQFFKEMNVLRETARQEIYYLVDYAEKAQAPSVRLDTNVLDRYVGIYEGPFGGDAKSTFTVTREGNQLFEELTGGRKLEIIPQSETRFAFKDMNAQLEFMRDASGKVTKRTMTYNGQTSEAKKIK
ncbi:DUF3471 domain-containing protein [Spirosoma sp. KUDC1026]|uniref:DUF3471 domain-containing protein n=1 Tax=Spirosoma sp. KUDC1026 TaxID=2745947 RepID=UPI00159B89E4|nr:DUF3471 domain-containing protein [Spirosoma sp. KUDC1026]QKZ13500.1 DUF3471 domain-containing protein [Spirosoma sp. KUDC1026]